MRAFNLYRSSLGDLAMREEVLARYLPHVPFADHSPQQLPHDEEADLPAEELLRGLPIDVDTEAAVATGVFGPEAVKTTAVSVSAVGEEKEAEKRKEGEGEARQPSPRGMVSLAAGGYTEEQEGNNGLSLEVF